MGSGKPAQEFARVPDPFGILSAILSTYFHRKMANRRCHFYVTNYHKTKRLETTHIYSFTVSVGQEARHRLAGCLRLRVSRKDALKMLAETAVIPRLDSWWRGLCPSSLCGCWRAADPCWLLAGGDI